MVTNEKLIGDKFEEIFLKNFSGFTHVESKGILPDFFNQEHNFWVETKTGNIEWGVRIKRKQIENFKRLSQPVVYYLGLHDFDLATERLYGRSITGKRNYLTRNFNIKETYFISDLLMQKLWEKEKRISKNGKQEYCIIKKHVLNRIFYNKYFGLKGLEQSSEKYYGYDKNDFLVSNSSFPSLFLHKEKESGIISYLFEEK